MTDDQTPTESQQSMRIVLPELYKAITNNLKDLHNIHSYDIQAYVIKETSGYQIIIYFGDGFAHQKSQYFSEDAIKHMTAEVTDFIETIGDSCKEIMIADYFKMMKM